LQSAHPDKVGRVG